MKLKIGIDYESGNVFTPVVVRFMTLSTKLLQSTRNLSGSENIK
jgi:hypothetical protein